jgi:hypothetical protein
MSQVRDLAQQLATIKSLEVSAKLEVGSNAYIITVLWVKSWQHIVGYGAKPGPSNPRGPIVNNSLRKDGKLNWQSKIEKLLFIAFRLQSGIVISNGMMVNQLFHTVLCKANPAVWPRTCI